MFKLVYMKPVGKSIENPWLPRLYAEFKTSLSYKRLSVGVRRSCAQ